GRDAAEAALVFVRLLKGDADDLGELLQGHAEAEPPLADAAGDAKIDHPGQLRPDSRIAPGIHGAPKVMVFKVSATRSATGVPTTISTQGRMNSIIGIASRTGRRAARSSKRA